jgi:hypothetical protein
MSAVESMHATTRRLQLSNEPGKEDNRGNVDTRVADGALANNQHALLQASARLRSVLVSGVKN